MLLFQFWYIRSLVIAYIHKLFSSIFFFILPTCKNEKIFVSWHCYVCLSACVCVCVCECTRVRISVYVIGWTKYYFHIILRLRYLLSPIQCVRLEILMGKPIYLYDNGSHCCYWNVFGVVWSDIFSPKNKRVAKYTCENTSFCRRLERWCVYHTNGIWYNIF